MQHSKTLLETSRLRIREFTLDDVDDLLEINSDPRVLKYIDPTRTTSREKEIEEVGRIRQEYIDTPGLGVWAVDEKSSGAFSGLILLRTLYDTGEYEIGFRTTPPNWGRGFATESVRAVLAHGFNTIEAPVIVGLTMPGNIASQRVLLKAGLRHMGQRTLPECADIWPVLEHFRLERGDYLKSAPRGD